MGCMYCFGGRAFEMGRFLCVEISTQVVRLGNDRKMCLKPAEEGIVVDFN